MKVTIFTIANIRPDFIEIQYDSIKKFLKDTDFEYIVFNNAFNNPKRYQVIEDICRRLGIRSIKVNHYRDYNNDPSLIVSACLNDMWQKHLRHMKDILFYIDSDMFLIKDLSVNEMMNGYDFGFVPNYRGKNFEVMYAWTGLMFFNMNTLPNPKELVWDTGVVLGHRVDVGGLNHYYLQKYKDKIRVRNLEMWHINDIERNADGTEFVTGSLNGNVLLRMWFNGDASLKKLETPDVHISKRRFFPYQTEVADYHSVIAQNYIKFITYIDSLKVNFPRPLYFDFFKTDTGRFEDCFIFHYKSGSNWLSSSTKEYNKEKTIAFCDFMSKLGVKSNFNLLKQHQTFFVEEDNHVMFPPSKLRIMVRKIICMLKRIRQQRTILELRKNTKVYDVFSFFNELDMLEMRLNILDPYVDYFVIVEATETFSGQPKKLFYQENKERFKKWHHKIIHHVISDYPHDIVILALADKSANVPKDIEHWRREFYQKESIKKALVGLNDKDICFVGDVDEIWNYRRKYSLLDGDVFKLRLKVYSYYLNNRSSEKFAGTIITRFGTIKNACLNHLRTQNLHYLNNGGWHFTNMGGLEQIRAKLNASYTDESYNTPEVQNMLEKRLRENVDYIGRKFKFVIDERGLPEYLIENRSRYMKYFK